MVQCAFIGIAMRSLYGALRTAATLRRDDVTEPVLKESESVPALAIRAEQRWRVPFASVPRFGWAMAAPLVTLGISVATNALASRTLGPSGFGQFAIATVTLTLLGIMMSGGMPATMIRFCTQLDDAVNERARYSASAWSLVMLAVLVSAIGIYAFHLAAPDVLLRWMPLCTAPLIIAGAIGVAATEMASAEARMTLSFRGYFRIMTTSALARLAGLSVALLFAGAVADRAIAGFAIAYFVTGIFHSRHSLVNCVHRLQHDAGQLRRPLRRLLTFGAPVAGSTAIVSAISYSDTFIVANIFATHELGLYAAGVRLTVVQSIIIGGIATVALPLAARAVAAGQQRMFARQAVLWGGIVGVFMTSALVVGSPRIVAAVYGAGYAQSAAIFAVLCVGYLLNYIGNALSQLLYAANAPWLMLRVHVLQLVLQLATLPAAARAWGINGVATAAALVNLLAVAVVLVMVARLLRQEAPLAYRPMADSA